MTGSYGEASRATSRLPRLRGVRKNQVNHLELLIVRLIPRGVPVSGKATATDHMLDCQCYAPWAPIEQHLGL